MSYKNTLFSVVPKIKRGAAVVPREVSERCVEVVEDKKSPNLSFKVRALKNQMFLRRII
jgi:hypothetical protein